MLDFFLNIFIKGWSQAFNKTVRLKLIETARYNVFVNDRATRSFFVCWIFLSMLGVFAALVTLMISWDIELIIALPLIGFFSGLMATINHLILAKLIQRELVKLMNADLTR